ncbi:chlorocatechol 1,2-dioxygenase [Ascosphaera apis ARSEF 7405]|uniref:Chlorocatechol 1,2-dioxygenase n=1 Tax=Ascosphaera apis ARSEF 7405 TaxID=392613 RepID=A0A167UV47_9EURO|nr:chlorocatechol 1,2-dioxygenase [Ascosphaera apis ARSEF 7405]
MVALGDHKNEFDPNFTQAVIDLIGPKTSPRNREIMAALIRHLHDFARDCKLTSEEWLKGVNFVNRVGQISTPTRNEGHRICDILGLETVVDEIEHKLFQESGADEPTSSAILGPFWSPNAPFRETGDSIAVSPHKGRPALMHGYITDTITKKPIPNAVFDIWQASANGKYDFQDPENQVSNNLRGKFRTDENGYYRLYCLHPTAYSLPTDGPSYELINLLDRHPMRPAHIHLMITHPDYHGVVNQLYPKDDPWLDSDTVFAVKNDLIVEFKPLKGDPKAELELRYDIRLAPKSVPTLASKL